jgi:hypothetical protein
LLSSLQLQWEFNVKLLKSDGAFIKSGEAQVLTTIADNMGNLHPVSELVQVSEALLAVVLQVFNLGNNISCRHIIPYVATCFMTGDRQHEQSIVNCHKDLATENDL